MTSRPAIEPAISTLPVMNQLMANVSSVPSARQLTALRTDLACVSVPRNSTRQCLPFGVDPHLSRQRAAALHDRQLPHVLRLGHKKSPAMPGLLIGLGR